MSKFYLRTFGAALFAAAALTSPVVGQSLENTDVDGDIVIRWTAVPLAMAPLAAAIPAVAMTSVTVGPQVTGFPCFGGAAGCVDTTASTVAIPMPLAVIPQKGAVTYTVQFQDNSYTGTCSAAYTLTQGTTAIAHKSYSLSGGCKSGYVYTVAFNTTVPAKPGATKLSGSVVGGTNKSAASLGIAIQ